MAITTQSAKAKGRNLQNWIRDYIISLFPRLTDEDVRGTAMGQSGEDVLLSPAARKKFPYSVEAKARAKHGVYTMYDQAVSNSKSYEPLLIIKANRRKPLAVVDAEHFMNMVKIVQDKKK